MINRIKVKGFKSIRDVCLDLDPITVLVGRSGTGKSNLIGAIRFLRNYLIDPNLAIEVERGWQWICNASGGPYISFEVEFSVPNDTSKYIYLLKLGAHPQPKVYEERLVFNGADLFAREFNPKTGKYEWIAEPKDGIDFITNPGPILGLFPSLQLITFAYVILSHGIGYYHFPADVMTQFQTTPQRLIQYRSKIPGFSEDGTNYREVIRAITQDFHHPRVRKAILASLQRVNSTIESVELDSLIQPQHVIVAHKFGDSVRPLNLDQESDGVRRFYAHLLALYQNPSKLTLIFEEPENAIFPGALSLLAEEFRAAPKESRGQVILTTHSPNLLDSIDVENVRVVTMDNGNTIVGRVAEEQRHAVKDNLLRTGELLTVVEPKMEIHGTE